MPSSLIALCLLALLQEPLPGLGDLTSPPTADVAVEVRAESFQDVLETPVLKSRLLSRTLFNGITKAGRRLVGVGQRGNIFYSDDAGKSWTQAAVPVSSDLTAVSFPTAQQGWAVGHDGVVLHSADAGATWVKQFEGRAAAQVMAVRHKSLTNCAGCHEHLEAPQEGPEGSASVLMAETKAFQEKGADKSFLDVWFETEQSGYIVGAFNLVFHTADGGATWDPWFDRTENLKRLHLYGIRRVGQDLFIVGEQGLVLKQERASGQFKALKTPYNGTFFGLVGSGGALLAYGMRGHVYRSQDGGGSWQPVETGTPLSLVGSTVTADGRVVLVDQAGHLLVSGDSGASFQIIKQERPFPATAIVALDLENIMLAGLRGLQIQPAK